MQLVSQQIGGGKCVGSEVVFKQRLLLLLSASTQGLWAYYTQLPEFTHVCFRDVCHQLPAASTVVDPRQRQGGTRAGAPRLPPTPGAHTGPALGPAGLPGPLPRPRGPAGGDLCSAAPVPSGTSVFTRSRFRRRCEVFREATLLPANSPALLDSEDLREGWGPTPESDQLLHFASNGQLCTGTKPQPHLSMVTRLFFGSSYRGSAGAPSHRGQLAQCGPRAVEPGPESLRHVSFVFFVL